MITGQADKLGHILVLPSARGEGNLSAAIIALPSNRGYGISFALRWKRRWMKLIMIIIIINFLSLFFGSYIFIAVL